MSYFVITYDRRRGESTIVETYDDDRRADALQHRFALEDEHAGNADMEIVVLGAPTQESLLATHARYFKTAQELFADLKSAALAATSAP